MNRFLCVGVLVGIVLAGTRQGQAAAMGGGMIGGGTDPALVGWWALDDEDGGMAVDSSGWNRHGILHGHPKWVEGYLGGALQLDGRGDYIATSYAQNLLRWTVSVWVKSPAAPTAVPASGPVHREANYQLNWNHQDARFRGAAGMRIGETWHAASFGPLAADTWYHLAATFDGTALRAYVNGAVRTTEATAQGVPFVESAPLLFGRHARAEQFFAGTIDDVQIYDGALGEEAIRKVMQGTRRTAWNPQPEHGASMNLHEVTTLSWSAGEDALMHDVYIGLDEDAVRAADRTSSLYWGRQTDTSFALGGLLRTPGRYFWRIDEVQADGTTVHKGPVWTFAVLDHLIIDDFESYTDEESRRISHTWLDGSSNGTGSLVGNPTTPFAERQVIHGGKQAMPLSYCNSYSPFYSEAMRKFAPVQDWTADQGTTLSLWFRGDLVSFAETSSGTVTMSATGADIWSDNDQFRYAYKRLTGDGTLVARVDSLVNTNAWAKVGVMIRQTLDRDSAHAFMLITPEGRRAFQNRPIHRSGTCLSAHSSRGTVSLPCWIKIERKGNQFTGYYSADGVNWIKQPDNENTEANRSPNPQTIGMPTSVYVGLALSSNAAGVVTTATFSHVAATGRTSGQWQTASIGVDQPGNSPDLLYVAVEDSAGKAAVVSHPDPAATNALAWTEWRIPLSSFAGVNLAKVKTMYIGVGDRQIPIPDGTGRIYIDDIRVVK